LDDRDRLGHPSSPSDWKRPETICQGCQYQDFMDRPMDPGENYSTRHEMAECWIVGKCKPAK
jgi:hypothetical protein